MKVGSGAAAVELKQRGKDERMKEEEMADSLSLTLYTFQAINGQNPSWSLFHLFQVWFCGLISLVSAMKGSSRTPLFILSIFPLLVCSNVDINQNRITDYIKLAVYFTYMLEATKRLNGLSWLDTLAFSQQESCMNSAVPFYPPSSQLETI